MVTAMGRFEHGGDIYTNAGVVDFSANINPLGMPKRVVEALREGVEAYDAYPDPTCRDLRDALARAEGVPAENIVCTAGATDLMHRVCAAVRPGRALVTAPCFSGYEQALEQVGAAIERHVLREEDDFALTDAILDCELLNPLADRAGDIVFLCTPNNPTGLTIGRDLLVRILRSAWEVGAVLVLDECFLDFTHEASAVPLCRDFPNLVVMKAFTKLYAMAGVRLGYGICRDPRLVAALNDVGQPWTVSTPAQVAGVAALQEPGWIERTLSYVDEQRAVLARGLAACRLRVIPGQANYLMFQSERSLYEPLLQRGFLIRRCANYVGLDDSWYRIAVRTAQQNAAFLAALKEVCA